MSITAVVPVWNGRDLLMRLLDTLDVQTERAAEVLVVDNGSSDGAAEAARARGARVILMGRNAGFAAAVNRGIREAGSQWIAVLNSDVELAPDYFEKLRAADAWFATGKILRAGSNDRIDATFDVTCRGGTSWRVGSGFRDGPWFSADREIHSAPCTAVLFRAELFHRVGFLEESFDSYLEDVDFGLRCAAKGLAGRYVPAARAWHRGSATLGRWHPEVVRRIARNQIFLLARHYPHPIRWPVLVAQLLWGAVAFRHRAGLAWLRGISQGMRSYSVARSSHESLDLDVLERLLVSGEKVIYELQSALGFDTYWRLYFLLTGGSK